MKHTLIRVLIVLLASVIAESEACSGDTGNSGPSNRRPAGRNEFGVERNKDSLTISYGNSAVATYFFRHDKTLRPFFAHLNAPSGTQLTRNFPPSDSDRSDHADMHPGLWMAFGDISGEDFWRNKSRVFHEELSIGPSGDNGRCQFTQRKSYRRADGSIVCLENFECTFHALTDGYLIEWDSTFVAPEQGEFFFGDQEEMGLGIRVATGITELTTGQITDSEGRRGAANVWSQPSKWCDYSGHEGDETIGITILCHPDNFRPSWMHARNYGLIAANPFGRKAMNKGPSSRIVVKDGQPLRLRYGILLHGPVPDLNQIYRQYVKLADENQIEPQ